MRALANHVRGRSVSYVALFLALTGSAYAAVSVQGRDVVDRSLTGADVRNGSLLAASLTDPTALAAAKRGRRGPRGLRGPTGYRGVPGIPGAPGPAGKMAVQVVSASASNAADVEDTSPDVLFGEVRCPAGTGPIGGGGAITALGEDGQVYKAPSVHIRESYVLAAPADGSTTKGWRVIGVEELGGFDDQWSVTVWAYCVPERA